MKYVVFAYLLASCVMYINCEEEDSLTTAANKMQNVLAQFKPCLSEDANDLLDQCIIEMGELAEAVDSDDEDAIISILQESIQTSLEIKHYLPESLQYLAQNCADGKQALLDAFSAGEGSDQDVREFYHYQTAVLQQALDNIQA